MSEDEQIPDGIREFLELLDAGKKKFQAAELLSTILLLTMESGDDPETMDQVMEAIITYGDKRVLEAMSK